MQSAVWEPEKEGATSGTGGDSLAFLPPSFLQEAFLPVNRVWERIHLMSNTHQHSPVLFTHTRTRTRTREPVTNTHQHVVWWGRGFVLWVLVWLVPQPPAPKHNGFGGPPAQGNSTIHTSRSQEKFTQQNAGQASTHHIPLTAFSS